MKKTILLALVAFCGYGLAYGDSLTVKAPVTDKGVAAHPLYAGYSYKVLSSTTETLVCTAPCVLAGIIMSTGAQASKVYVRDTATADNGNSTYVLDLNFHPATDCFTHQQPIIPLPLRATYGFAVDLSAVNAAERVTVLYMDLD